MDRTSKKAKHVLWNILGKPANMTSKPTRSQKRRNEILQQENSRRRIMYR